MSSYEITVTLKEKKAKNPVAGSDSEAENTDGGNLPKEIAKGYGVVKKFVSPFISQVITAQTSTVSLRTGAEELQERLQFSQNAIRQGFGVIESVVVGGLLGGAPGAIVGAAMGVAQTAMTYEFRRQELQMQKDVEDVSLRLLNIRAGGSLAAFSGSRETNQ